MLWQAFGRWGALGAVPSGGAVSTQAPTPVVLVNKATAASVTDATAITYTVEQYDPQSVIAVTSGTFTIPSSGLYRVTAGSSCATNAARQFLHKNGTNAVGGLATCVESNGPRWTSGASAILNLAASDTITLVAGLTTTYGSDAASYTALGIERLESTTQYALVRKSADQLDIGTSAVAITFATEVVDIGGWFDSGASTTRLTVPSGLTRVRLSGNFATGNTGGLEGEIRKNGSASVLGMPCRRRNWTGDKYFNFFSPPVNVSSGDYFEMYATTGDGSTDILNRDDVWFSIEEVPAAIKSCLVYKSASQTINADTDTVLTWDSEDHDPDAMHSTVTNNSRLIVPSGCTYARLSWQIRGTGASTVHVHAQVKKNGSADCYAGMDSEAAANQRLGGVTAWMAVTPGDYFEIWAYGNTGTASAAGGSTGSWAAMECI